MAPSELLKLEPMELQFTIGVYKEHLISIPQHTKGVDKLWTWRERAQFVIEQEQLDPVQVQHDLERTRQWALDSI